MILQHHNKDENNDDMTLSTHSSLNGLTANEEEHHCYQETEGVLEINSESTNNASMTKAEGDRPGTPAVINQFPSADVSCFWVLGEFWADWNTRNAQGIWIVQTAVHIRAR